MARYKILVVDDEKTRNSKYESLFRVLDPESNDFELEFANNSFAEFLDKNSLKTFHCYIVDISLNGKGWSNTSNPTSVFRRVLEEIGNDKPIVLLSSKWGNVITWLNDFILEYNIVNLIDWKAVEDGSASGMIYISILAILKKMYKFSDFHKADDESINILHISDLQFGEINKDKDPVGAKKKALANMLIDEIPNYLSCNRIKIDFIAITGDITENALPSEFEIAESWIRNFCEKIFGRYDSERILFINGNHDYNLSLNSLNHFRFKYGSSPLKMEPLVKPIEDYTQMSFTPYKNFLMRMTNENPDSLTYYNYKFQHLGIRFLFLNTLETYKVEISSSVENMFNITDETFSNFIDKDGRRPNTYFFTIILSHASPNSLGYLALSDKKDLWEKFENSVSRFGKSLLLSGHHHESSFLTPIPVKHGGKLCYIQARTFLSTPSDSGVPRGFSIVTLNRKAKQVTKIINQLYSIGKHGIDVSDWQEEPLIY